MCMRHIAACVITPLIFAAAPGLAADAVPQVRQEIQRLQTSLKENPIADPDSPAPMVESGLKDAGAALDAGRFYQGLEALGQAESVLFGIRFTRERRPEIERGGMPAFQSAWDAESRELANISRKTAGTNWDQLPSAVAAIAEAAHTTARPLLDGGIGFANATGPKDGLFYVGQAQGEAVFARFCTSLKQPKHGSSFAVRSFLPELQRLQEKTNAAFHPPQSVDLHPRFIALNSTLKLAEELDAAKLYAGSLYKYLESTRHFGMLSAAPLDAAAQAALKQDLNAAHRKVDAEAGDNSIAQLFLERADAQTAHADGSAPSADEWRSARVIVDQVLPAYFAARTPAAANAQPAGKTVDITLVRWPYT